MIRQRPLGRTGLSVSELALGGLFVSSWGAEYDQARDTIRHALTRGINYIDTAPGYGDSEAVIGRALAELAPETAGDRPVILSTKLGGRPQPFRPQDRDCLLASLEESLRLLGRDHLDIVMIHEPDRPGQYDWWADPVGYHGPVLDLLQDLKREGLIRAIGLGGTTVYEMARLVRTGRFDVVLTAFNYSLLWREAETDLLPAARAQGMGIVIGSPLQQGALSRRYDAEVAGGAAWLSPPRRAQYQALYALLDELDIPIAELGLRFVLSNPDISCVLTGPRSPAELESSVSAAAKGPLPPDVLARLDEIAAKVPFRPCAEPFFLPFGRPYHGPGPA